MFPNFEPGKGNKEAPAGGKEQAKGKKAEAAPPAQEFTPTENFAGQSQDQANLFKAMGTNASTFVPSSQANAGGKNNLKPNQKQAQNNRKISPQVNTQQPFGQNPQTAQLSNVNRAQDNNKKAQMPTQVAGGRNDSADVFAQNQRSNLNVTAAAFTSTNPLASNQAATSQDPKEAHRNPPQNQQQQMMQ